MKRLRLVLQQGLVLYLSLVLLILGGLPENVTAALIPSNAGGADGVVKFDRAADTQTIQRVLESKMVAQRLTDMGMSVEEVQASMDKLSPEDLHQIAANMDGVQAGGGVVGFVIVVMVLVVLALLIVYLAKRV
jgi:uncharacterized protein DUF6627